MGFMTPILAAAGISGTVAATTAASATATTAATTAAAAAPVAAGSVAAGASSAALTAAHSTFLAGLGKAAAIAGANTLAGGIAAKAFAPKPPTAPPPLKSPTFVGSLGTVTGAGLPNPGSALGGTFGGIKGAVQTGGKTLLGQ